jgi:hypothetical protein
MNKHLFALPHYSARIWASPTAPGQSVISSHRQHSVTLIESQYIWGKLLLKVALEIWALRRWAGTDTKKRRQKRVAADVQRPTAVLDLDLASTIL